MKQHILNATTDLKKLSGCWIFKEGEYFMANARITGYELPILERKYEHILKNMKIPYRIIKKKDKEVCEYWSPEYYEERKFTGMLYAYQFCEYKYVAPSYTGTIVSIKTVEMARKVEKEILKEKRKSR